MKLFGERTGGLGFVATTAALTGLMLATPAAAAPTESLESSIQQDGGAHEWALTFSPLMLIDSARGDDRLNMLEVTVERALARKWSYAPIIGFGLVRVTGESGVMTHTALQGRYYLIGHFNHGMNLAAQVGYFNAFVPGDVVDVDATGLSASGLLGYKIAADYGLTLDLQAGVAALAVGGRERHVQAGVTHTLNASGVVPTARLNIGWSF